MTKDLAKEDVFSVQDGGNAITLHFSEIKSARAFRDSFPAAIVSDAPRREGDRVLPSLGFYDGCHVELRDGTIRGPVTRRTDIEPHMRPWLNETEAWYDNGGYRIVGGESPWDVVRVLPRPPGARVKPLQWRPDGTARALGLVYIVGSYSDPLKDGLGNWISTLSGGGYSGRHHSEEEAKASCQVDFETRILALLPEDTDEHEGRAP